MAPDKLDQVLNKHSHVFKEGHGTLNNVRVKLAVDLSVTPMFHKARSIPFALKETVEPKDYCYSFRLGSSYCVVQLYGNTYNIWVKG